MRIDDMRRVGQIMRQNVETENDVVCGRVAIVCGADSQPVIVVNETALDDDVVAARIYLDAARIARNATACGLTGNGDALNEGARPSVARPNGIAAAAGAHVVGEGTVVDKDHIPASGRNRAACAWVERQHGRIAGALNVVEIAS